MILHQIEALAAAGVTDIVLAVNYRPDIMSSALKKVPNHHRYPGQLQSLEKGHTDGYLSTRRSTMSKLNSPSRPNLLGQQAP